MKLYFAPGTCSLAPHIALREAGFDFALEQVDHRKKLIKSDGSDFRAINSKGQVPVLELDDGARLTEVPVILQYIADLKPEAGLLPPAGMSRLRLLEWLNYITAELHKMYAPLFDRSVPEDYKVIAREQLGRRFDWVDGQLAGKTWLVGDHLTVADIYLFVVLRWAQFIDVDATTRPNLKAFIERMMARPTVTAAMAAEGIKT